MGGRGVETNHSPKTFTKVYKQLPRRIQENCLWQWCCCPVEMYYFIGWSAGKNILSTDPNFAIMLSLSLSLSLSIPLSFSLFLSLCLSHYLFLSLSLSLFLYLSLSPWGRSTWRATPYLTATSPETFTYQLSLCKVTWGSHWIKATRTTFERWLQTHRTKWLNQENCRLLVQVRDFRFTVTEVSSGLHNL